MEERRSSSRNSWETTGTRATSKTTDDGGVNSPNSPSIPPLPPLSVLVETMNAMSVNVAANAAAASSSVSPPLPPLTETQQATIAAAAAGGSSSVSQNIGSLPNINKSQQPIAPPRPLDDYGFYLDSSDCTPIAVPPSFKQKKDLQKLELEWLKILGNWKVESYRQKTKVLRMIKKMARKGIPDSVRGKAWMILSGADRKLEAGKFQILCNRAQTEQAPSIFDVIDRDVNRCFPTHSMFSNPEGEGQKNIRRVLQSYALYNPTLGYCQGMGMIAGLFLMRMSAEDAFWTLVTVLDSYIPDYHSVNLYQLRVDAAAFEVCFKKYMRSLSRHMRELIPLTYMTQWFLTVYIMALPWPTVLRVWDMFLHDGPKALFRAGIAILMFNKSYLFKHCPSSSDQLAHLLTAPKELHDPDAFIKQCLSISLGHRQLEKIRSQVKRAHASLEENLNKVGVNAANA